MGCIWSDCIRISMEFPYFRHAILAGRSNYYPEEAMEGGEEEDADLVKRLSPQVLREHIREELPPGKVFDVEDLKFALEKVGLCPYTAAKILARDADIIFCPFNYLICRSFMV